MEEFAHGLLESLLRVFCHLHRCNFLYLPCEFPRVIFYDPAPVQSADFTGGKVSWFCLFVLLSAVGLVLIITPYSSV